MKHVLAPSLERRVPDPTSRVRSIHQCAENSLGKPALYRNPVVGEARRTGRPYPVADVIVVGGEPRRRRDDGGNVHYLTTIDRILESIIGATVYIVSHADDSGDVYPRRHRAQCVCLRREKYWATSLPHVRSNSSHLAPHAGE